MKTRFIAAALTVAIITASAVAAVSSDEQKNENQAHAAWVAKALRRMQTIAPGMTRKQLLEVFAEEGGLSSTLQRTYASQDCPYFKVDVAFKLAGPPQRDKEGRLLNKEDDQDRIATISRPYLDWTITD